MLRMRELWQQAIRSIHSAPTAHISALLLLLLLANAGTKHISEIYLLGSLATVALAVVPVLLIGLLHKRFAIATKWLWWFAVALATVCYLVWQWPGPANHLYVFGYMCLVFVLVFRAQPENQSSLLRHNALFLFGGIMLLAVIQKVITAGYLDGSINAFWIANGGYFEPLQLLSHDWANIVNENALALDAYYNENPRSVAPLELESPVAHLQLWGQLLAYAIVLSEIVVPLLFAFGRSAWLRHGSVLVFLALTFLARQETGFFSLLCILGLSTCTTDEPFWRKSYLTAFALIQLLMLSEIGYI